MILSDGEIVAALSEGHIVIEPLPEEDQFETSSLDLRLGAEAHEWDESRLRMHGVDVTVDPSRTNFLELARGFTRPARRRDDGSYVIRSGSFVLGITHEHVRLPLDSGIAARVEGRSSLARMGLMVHLTAPVIHAGFSGNITLELINHGPFDIRLVPEKTRPCQLVFERLGAKPTVDISTIFQGQVSPTGAGPE